MSSPPAGCGARRTARRRWGLLVVGSVAFVVTALLVQHVQPPLRARTRRPQLDAFLRDKDGYDAVFIGSSRVQRGIRPDVVDARLSAPGRPFRSFNLGAAGMQSFEADRLVREVVASRPARLRWLIVEAPSWTPERTLRQSRTERFVDWHDLDATALVLGSVWNSPWPWLEKLGLAWRHVRAFVARFANYATGERFLEAPDPGWEGLVRRLARMQGYVPLDAQAGGTPARRRRQLLKHPEEYRQRVDRLIARGQRGTPPRASVATYNRRALAGQVEAARGAGLRLVYVLLPTFGGSSDYDALRREGLLEHLVDLQDPLKHPDLYEIDNHFDNEHLNREGARRLSERLADALEPLVREDASPSASDSEHAVH